MAYRQSGAIRLLYSGWVHYGLLQHQCGNFVQIHNSIVLGVGGTLLPISTDGGQQYAITMTWQLYQGNWWVAVGNKWVGYYPGANFRGGQMSKNSKYIMYGGETASQVGDKSAGQMGSGKYAGAGSGHAAYQSRIYYDDTSLTPRWTALQVLMSTPQCYTIWGDPNTYLFFGGPECIIWEP